MFTGIIETQAKILSFEAGLLKIQRPESFTNLSQGQSIAVNGACLSVISFSDAEMHFEVVPETLQKTNLQNAQKVNLERALPVDGRFEGHIVLGHIDGVTKLLERKQEKLGQKFTFDLLEGLNQYIVQKGSIALNGISLTIADITEDSFSVAVIPHTLKNTNLSDVQIGDMVNVEADVLAKYLEKQQPSS